MLTGADLHQNQQHQNGYEYQTDALAGTFAAGVEAGLALGCGRYSSFNTSCNWSYGITKRGSPTT